MINRKILALILSLALLAGGAARASTLSGIDTPAGNDALPLAVEGAEGMRLMAAGTSGQVYVGVGTTTPQTTLDVNGPINLGRTVPVSGNAIVAGVDCPSEGMFGYDMTNHGPVFCNAQSKWASVGGIPTTRTWHNMLSTRSVDQVYQNTNSYPIEISVTYTSQGPDACVYLDMGASTTGLLTTAANVGRLGVGSGVFQLSGVWNSGDVVVTAEIPPNWYYAIVTWTGAQMGLPVAHWFEMY